MHLSLEPPEYLAHFLAFVEAGATLVHITTRGSGDYGAQWWQDGRRRNKLNSCQDFIDALRHLAANEMIDPDRVGLYAGAGPLGGTLITRAPELFRAAVLTQTLGDMIRFSATDGGAWLQQEYGDPNDPEDRRILATYSPYHNVADGRRYPATLVIAAADDDLTPVWQSAKLVARLQQAQAPRGRPVLLRTWSDLDHIGSAVGSPAFVAEWMAFLAAELGLEPRA